MGKNNTAERAWLYAQLPALGREDFDDFTKLNALRDWCYEHVAAPATQECGLDMISPGCEMDWPLDRLFQTFADDGGGLHSDSMCRLFVRLARLVGWRTRSFAVGPPNLRYHPALVAIQQKARQICVVVEPFLNYTIADATGGAIDLRDVVRLLVSRRSFDLRMLSEGGHTKRRFLYPSKHKGDRFLRVELNYFWYATPIWEDWLFARSATLNPLYAYSAPVMFGDVDAVLDQCISEAAAIGERLTAEPNAQRFALASATKFEPIDKMVPAFTRDEVRDFFAHDAWLQNYAVGSWEFQKGETTLLSYPRDVSIPIADVCNARCTFCTSWLEGRHMLKLADLDRYEAVIRHAMAVGLAGHGEPLSHPEIPAILDRLARWLDRRARCYVITNGVFLERHMEALLAARVASFAVSLNAATAGTHDTVMGMGPGAFSRVLGGIRELVRLRDSGKHSISVSISMVLTRENMEEVAAFVRLGNELGVDMIQLKTLAGNQGPIPGLNYHTLPPYLHPEFARLKNDAVRAVADSKVRIVASPESWDTPVFPAEIAAQFAASPPPIVRREEALRDKAIRAHYDAHDKYQRHSLGEALTFVDDFDGANPYGRTPRFACQAPYFNLYMNDFSYNIVPCCYMGRVPGYQPIIWNGKDSFFAAWNSPAMVNLRTRLRDGPLFNMCTKCPAAY